MPTPSTSETPGSAAAHCAVDYDPDSAMVTMRWSGYAAGADFRAANDRVLAEITERRAGRLLGDIEHLGAIDGRDQAWLAQEWLPRAAGAGLRFVALVTPAFGLEHAPVRLVGEQLPPGMRLEYFDDLEGGRTWLREQ